MKDKGIAHIGIGTGKGDDKASEAVKMAVESPLLETTITGATHVIINVSGDITLTDASDAASYVQELAGDEVNIIFGAMYDASKADTCTITVIATGLEDVPQNKLNYMQHKTGGIITPTSLQGKALTPPTPLNTTMQKPIVLPTAPAVKPLNGLKPLSDIRSSVKEQSLNIPSFLQKK